MWWSLMNFGPKIFVHSSCCYIQLKHVSRGKHVSLIMHLKNIFDICDFDNQRKTQLCVHANINLFWGILLKLKWHGPGPWLVGNHWSKAKAVPLREKGQRIIRHALLHHQSSSLAIWKSTTFENSYLAIRLKINWQSHFGGHSLQLWESPNFSQNS